MPSMQEGSIIWDPSSISSCDVNSLFELMQVSRLPVSFSPYVSGEDKTYFVLLVINIVFRVR